MASMSAMLMASVWLSMTTSAQEKSATHWREVYKSVVSRVYIIHCGTEKGSGFLAFDQRHVVTSLSVAGCGRTIWIQRHAKDEEWVAADLHAYNNKHDTALVIARSPLEGSPLPFSRAKTVEVGTPVGAIGHPYPKEGFIQKLTQQALSWSFVQGVIGRVTDDFVQVNMPLMTGYTGAPLIDRFGRVVGVLTNLGPRRYPIGVVARKNLILQLHKKDNPPRVGWPFFDFSVNLLARFSFLLGSLPAGQAASLSPTSQEIRLDFFFRDQWILSGYVGFDIFSINTTYSASLLFGGELAYRFLLPRQVRPYLNYIAIGIGAMGVSMQVSLKAPDTSTTVEVNSEFRLSFFAGLRFFSIVGQFSVGVFLNLQEMVDPTKQVVPILSVSWGI